MAARMSQNGMRGLWHSLQKATNSLHCGTHQVSNTRLLCASFHTSPAVRWQGQQEFLIMDSKLSKKRLHLTVITSAAFRRFNSSTAASEASISTVKNSVDAAEYIPPPPSLPDASQALSEMSDAFNALGEPTLQSLGLGSYWPSGLVQQGLEAMHVGLGLPWWGSIVVGTLILRILMFPIVIKAQKMSVNMMNHMPTVQRLQLKFTQARQRGNMLEAMQHGGELADYMKRNNVKPFGQLLMPMMQLPVFLSVFIGLRGMANLPVESMKTGGLLWFQDLTITGPFYGLPLITAFTFWMTIEAGVDGISSQSQTHVMKWILRAMPAIMLPFICNFPSAMLVYWLTSNSFSLVQVLFLKIPKVRQLCNIPERVQHVIEPTEKKGFIEGFKEAYSNMKASQQVSERQRLDEMALRKAAHGPIVKTYSYNPKSVSSSLKAPAEAAKQKL